MTRDILVDNMRSIERIYFWQPYRSIGLDRLSVIAAAEIRIVFVSEVGRSSIFACLVAPAHKFLVVI